MLSALVSLKGLIKTKSYHIDYPLFRLHYQATVCVLLAFCLILTAKILFGDTIDCKSRSAGSDSAEFYDNLCYSRGTFTEYAIDEDQVSLISSNKRCRYSPEDDPLLQQSAGVESAGNTTYPTSATVSPVEAQEQTFPEQFLADSTVGEFLKKNFRLVHRLIKNHNLCLSSKITYLYSGIQVPRETKEKYQAFFWHRYYQYIPIILFLQAVFFYFPHYLWKMWENGIVSSICKQLHDNRFAPTEYIEGNYHMIHYLRSCFTVHRLLVFKYYFCHLLLLINLISQIVVLNAIFNNQFITYGIDVFHYLLIDDNIYGLIGYDENNDDLNNPMDFVFPKVTACTTHMLSTGGALPDRYEFLCVLPLNILHDKFFLIIWVWFLILGFITILQIIFDVLYTSLPMLRSHIFSRRFGPHQSCSLSELFLLDLIGCNTDKFAFAALLRKLNKEDSQGSLV